MAQPEAMWWERSAEKCWERWRPGQCEARDETQLGRLGADSDVWDELLKALQLPDREKAEWKCFQN